MKIVPTFLAILAFVPSFFATTVVAENDFARRLEAAAGSTGSDHLRFWVIEDQLGGDVEGRNIYTNRRWKDRNQDKVIIPYQIETRYFTSSEIAKIERLTKELSDEVKVIQFVKRTNQAAYVRVVRVKSGCSSFVGKSGSGKSQDLNLDAWCFNNEGTIPHEVRQWIIGCICSCLAVQLQPKLTLHPNPFVFFSFKTVHARPRNDPRAGTQNDSLIF